MVRLKGLSEAFRKKIAAAFEVGGGLQVVSEQF